MNILVKFPTRNRAKLFLSRLAEYEAMKTTDKVSYLITLDTDDPTVNEEFIDEIIATCDKATICTDLSTSKIHAVNRDMEHAEQFDILVLASDDMQPVYKGWDERIISDMTEHHPDTDGVLYYPDGYTDLNTMCIMGRQYYERFNYIYHPSYTSLWCDNEFQDVAQQLGKESRMDSILFKHEHPANTGTNNDALYRENEKYYRQDHDVYLKRKAKNFEL